MAEKLYNMNENITKIPQKKRSSSKDGRSRSGHHQHKDQNQKTNSQKSKQSTENREKLARQRKLINKKLLFFLQAVIQGQETWMIYRQSQITTLTSTWREEVE